MLDVLSVTNNIPKPNARSCQFSEQTPSYIRETLTATELCKSPHAGHAGSKPKTCFHMLDGGKAVTVLATIAALDCEFHCRGVKCGWPRVTASGFLHVWGTTELECTLPHLLKRLEMKNSRDYNKKDAFISQYRWLAFMREAAKQNILEQVVETGVQWQQVTCCDH